MRPRRRGSRLRDCGMQSMVRWPRDVSPNKDGRQTHASLSVARAGRDIAARAGAETSLCQHMLRYGARNASVHNKESLRRGRLQLLSSAATLQSAEHATGRASDALRLRTECRDTDS